MPDNFGMSSQYTLVTKNLFPQYSWLAISLTNPTSYDRWADWENETLVLDDVLFVGLREGANIAEDVECQIYVSQNLLSGPDATFDDSGLKLILNENLRLPDHIICFWMDDDTLAHSLFLNANEVAVKGYYTANPNKLVVVLDS